MLDNLEPMLSHVAGRTVFVDDRKPCIDELLVGVFCASVARGVIKKLDIEQAKEIPGVIAIYTANDVTNNFWGTFAQDQPLLVKDSVNYHGEVIAIIAAKDTKAIDLAKREIKVEYEVLPAVLSIDDAKAKNQFLGEKQHIETGDASKALLQSEHVLSGSFESAGQDHFYLESQAAIAYPDEDGGIEVHTSSQNPSEIQHVVANTLNLPYNKVIAIVKRMGGAFGGKESQATQFAVYAAFVAKKHQCSARISLSKDEDMIICGKRHPYKSWYKVGFDKTGKITALEIDIYSDAGAYTDLSPAVLQRTITHIDNAYYIENISVTGHLCKTNLASNTAFRGFGGPQGVAIIESIIEDIATVLNVDPLTVRKVNLYQIDSRNITHYGQVVENNKLPELLESLAKNANYEMRMKKILEHNKKSDPFIYGISLTPVKFGISFTAKFLNQGNAQVNIHLDGTIQVSTGATEMGQGVNTKIQTIVAACFGVDMSRVKVMPTSTEKNHNTSATAASSGSDINGSAALIACEKLKARLSGVALAVFEGKHEREEILVDEKQDISEIIYKDNKVSLLKKTISFPELVKIAYMNRISLGEYGYYKTPHLSFDVVKGKGNPFLYFTQGAAVSEVQINRFTGECKIKQVDILMDLGRLIHYAIDHGQTVGGFVQGMGWVTTEKLQYDKEGRLLTHSPTTYKIPSIQDMPRVFNVNFIENNENKKNLKGSKAVGEPPLLLAMSVWTAIKFALRTLRKDNKAIPLKLPATAEEILLHLTNYDDFLQKIN